MIKFVFSCILHTWYFWLILQGIQVGRHSSQIDMNTVYM